MALSMKNTFVSLSLSGAMLFVGFLSGETPVASSNTRASAPFAQQAGLRNASEAESNETLKKAKRSFAAPYFSFGKSGFAQGAKQ